MFQGINAIEFGKKFHDNESCYLYLMGLKWEKVFHAAGAVMTNIIRARLIIIANAESVGIVKALLPILFFME